MLLPFFDTRTYLNRNALHVKLPDVKFKEDFIHGLEFLKCYNGSEGTFNSYRREVERLLQWCFHIKNINLGMLKRDDIEQYIHFCKNPPLSWIGLHKVPRFIEDGTKRIPNPVWRPFVAKVSKAATKRGELPDRTNFNLSQGSMTEILAIQSTFFNFLVAEEYIIANPVALIRQKSKFIRKHQQAAPVRRLSPIQWQMVYEVSETLAIANPEKHERTRFILSLLYGMYLRISELAASDRWIPTMNHFFKDAHGNWWFKTVGKGNKERHVAVSEAMLNSLARWRVYLKLSPMPSPADNSPLLPKIRGKGPLTDTAPIRRIVQHCFNLAEEQLRSCHLDEEADALQAATVHWLRHTGISEDVKIRPREHVRDDAGHSSSATTDRYIDIAHQERHKSAQQKIIILKPNKKSLP